jgi:chromosome segregation ATPase
LHFSPLFSSSSSSSRKKKSLREVTNTHDSNNDDTNNVNEEKEEKNDGLKKSSLELKYRATVALFQTHSNAFEELQRKLAMSERDVKRETTQKEALAQELESKKEELEALKETLETAQNQENTWRTRKESETCTMRTKVEELKQKFETNVEETKRAMASMELERVEFEGEMRRAKASEREAKAEAERLRRRLDSKGTETKEKEEKVTGLEEDVGRLKEALLERRKTQEDVEHALRETKKKCARLEGELRGRRQTRKNGGFSNGSSPAAANTTSTPSLTLATTSSTPSHDNAYATTTTTTGERPPWDDSFHASANRGGAPASSMMRPIAFPDTPMSSSTAHRSTSSPPNTNINNNNNRRNNDDELRDAFRHVKAFGQEIAHSWRERATRAENHREQLERNVKAINAKLVDEQLKNVKLLDELKITKATIVRLEAENATKESDQSSARKECERLSALLNEVNERNASIETVCKKHRDSALDASKRVSAAESILDALKAKEREAFRLRELSEQRLNICERELRAMSSELEKAKEHAWKMVEVQELTMRRAELAEKKFVEITTNNKMSTMNTGLGGKFPITEEAASPSIDAWIKTPTNGQTLMTPSVTRGGPTWTRTPLRKVA